MTSVRSTSRTLPLISAAVALAVLAACSSGGGKPGPSGKLATDATFTLGINADPGNLDPLATQLTAVRQLAAFLYDPLVNQQGSKIVSGLATSWTENGNKIVFTLRPGVTCSDGSALTATDIAANLNYVGDPKNSSGLIGITIPAGSTATADSATQVTLTTPKPTGFVLEGLAGIPIVCADGTADRKLLAQSADGTGPYILSSAVAGDHYTLTRRSGYTWGPAGASTASDGLPKTVVVKVVTNETTTANLLLTNGLQAATVAGPDSSRLKAAGLTSHPVQAMDGEFFYNEAPGRPTDSQDVRHALTQSLDLAALRKVATSDSGTVPTRLTGESPCTQNTVSGNVPAQNTNAAKNALASLAGKTLTLIYPAKLGAQASSATELAVQQWKSAGVTVQAKGLADAQLLSTAFQNADFDIAWLPADGQNPVQTQNTFSGPTPGNGGNNFADIDNSTYNRLSVEAAQQTGDSGCPNWAQADAALVKGSDVVPWAVIDYPLWATSAASFDTVYGAVVATSVRMHK